MSNTIENPMYLGVGAYNEGTLAARGDMDEVYRCERCKYPMHGMTTVYRWNDEWMCDECMQDAVMSLSPADRAEITGESIAHTEQMVDLAKTYDALAEVLGIEMSTAQERQVSRLRLTLHPPRN